jgi:hypothetical protein
VHTDIGGSCSNVTEVRILSWTVDKLMRRCCILPSRSEIATVMATTITTTKAEIGLLCGLRRGCEGCECSSEAPTLHT